MFMFNTDLLLMFFLISVQEVRSQRPLGAGELGGRVARLLVGGAAGESWQQFPAAALNVDRSGFGFVFFLLLFFIAASNSGNEVGTVVLLSLPFH